MSLVLIKIVRFSHEIDFNVLSSSQTLFLCLHVKTYNEREATTQKMLTKKVGSTTPIIADFQIIGK